MTFIGNCLPYLVLWHYLNTVQKFVLSSHTTRPSLFTTRPEDHKKGFSALGLGVPLAAMQGPWSVFPPLPTL